MLKTRSDLALTVGVVVLFLSASLGVAVASSGAVSIRPHSTREGVVSHSRLTTSTAGTKFANHLLVTAPVPKGAVLTAVLPAALINGGGAATGEDVIDVHRNFELNGSVNLEAFLIAHRAPGSVVSGPNTGSGSDIVSFTNYAVTLPFANRHISLEQIEYTAGSSSGGVKELRVDVEVEWLPIRTVLMPTSGVVTLTLYRKVTVAFGSSDPVSVTLTHAQEVKVRSAIASLSNTAGGLCMEDATLFRISASPGTVKAASWTGVATNCPSTFTVVSGSQRTLLSNGSCTLETLVASLLTKFKDNPTVVSLKSCIPA
jgi:hypothetical protein